MKILALLLLTACASTPMEPAADTDWAEETQAVVQGQGPKLQACHQKHGKGAKGPFGRMEILLHLEGGRATVTQKKSTLRSRPLEQCVLAVLRGAEWPQLPEGEHFTAEYPVDFQRPSL